MKDLRKTGARKSSLGEQGLRENGNQVGEGLRENRSLEGEGSRVNFKDKLCHYDDAISGKFSQPQPASFLCVKLALFFLKENHCVSYPQSNTK